MTAKHYLLYGSERYALAILRPLQEAIRARGHEVAWFFDGPGGAELQPGETLLPSTDAVRDFAPLAVLTSSNAVPHFFPGVKTEVFHGFDAGKPRHITRFTQSARAIHPVRHRGNGQQAGRQPKRS